MTKKSIILITAVALTATTLGIFSGTGQKILDKPLVQFWSWGAKNDKTECQLKSKTREFSHQPYYTGPLIDAHVHMPVSSRIVAAVAKRLGSVEFNLSIFDNTLTRDYFVCLFESEGISQNVGLFLTTRFSLWQELHTIKKFQKEYPGRVSPFFMPAPLSFLRVSPSEIRKTLDKNPGLFRGIGELKIFDGTSLENPHYSELYKIANDYNLIIMMHPHFDDKEIVKNILKQYPKVTFLFHGGDRPNVGPARNGSEEFIAEIMKEFDNAYYSISTIQLAGYNRGHALEMPDKEGLWNYRRENFDSEIAAVVKKWKQLIEKYPDRFMWETDRQRPQWIFDEDFGHFIEEAARTFIGKLDQSVREKFAYKNAENLLKK